MVRMFGTVSGAAVLAVAVRESVSGHGGEIVASPGSSVRGFSARGTSRERQDMIRRFHDSLFADHLGVSRTVYHLLDRVYWPGLRQDIRSYITSCAVCLARKSPCPRRAPMGHVDVGHRWDRVAMDILDMSVTTPKRNGGLFFSMDGILPAAR